MILFAVETLQWAFRPPFRPELVLAQMAAIGVGSTFIVSTTGFFTGMVLALQVTYAMSQFGAEGYVGGSVALSLARELAPVLTALMVIGRSGSAIATELGTMRVTEQIDAMETQDVVHGLFKSIVFGGVVAVITCYRGYAAEGGAKGVGEGTTRAVVMSSIAILVVDYALTLGSVGK